jgi:hypothetical protein
MVENPGRPAKKERNEQILILKKKGYTFRKIAEIFNIDLKTCHDIYKRETAKLKKSQRQKLT